MGQNGKSKLMFGEGGRKYIKRNSKLKVKKAIINSCTDSIQNIYKN